MDEMHQKLDCLKKYLNELGSVAVAFSSGVDSTFLLNVAYEVLGNRAIAITATSASFPKRERDEAKNFCRSKNIRQIMFDSEELNIKGFRSNHENRCYLCKYALFTKIKEIAKENGVSYVCEGSNMDDLSDYRPGMQAIRELDIKSPLRYAKLNKNEIRALSKEMGLQTWNKQSFACLASRFVYGEPISEEKLKMVDKAEQLLLDLGFHQLRVRVHGLIARIELLPNEFEKIITPEIREQIYTKFQKFGFSYVALDLKGYRTGSMNETIVKDKK
ncbi:MAG: ATP-dependent sacrificial sulfur transferase LarE [Alphaproteobacteria bacterium]|nr:ATP-dependent sacrificial sulfur transferase LarE [Alphaproteobacteria bacterium]